MANEELSKSTPTLKVPPLKIVLSSHQNNTVVNLGNVDDNQSFKSNDRVDAGSDSTGNGEIDQGNSPDTASVSDRSQKRCSKSSSDRNENDLDQRSLGNSAFSSSSSSSSSSDRSASATPSSESESIASNSTIISDNQQVKSKPDAKDGSPSSVRPDKESKFTSKVSFSERSNNGGSQNKRLHEVAEQSSDVITVTQREQVSNLNQRITRSSQRAAQQSKSENLSEHNTEETNVSDNQDKIHESVRKVKRRKGEPQDSEPDGSQSATQLTITMANICPADYQLPSQNSFELYRDIRKRPHKKLMKLTHMQPRVPHGFKDYLINSGPYLLDGNKLGVGINGQRQDDLTNNDQRKNINLSHRVPLRMKLSNFHKGSSLQPTNQRHSSYEIPKPMEAPKVLPVGSPLYELFQDQEKARHQMRLQHLKERERAILAAEQEFLRAHNKAAIADVNQKLHLSACTYFYYHERYHYLNHKSKQVNGVASTTVLSNGPDTSLMQVESLDTSISTILDVSTSKDLKNLSTGKDTSVNSGLEQQPVNDEVQDPPSNEVAQNSGSTIAEMRSDEIVTDRLEIPETKSNSDEREKLSNDTEDKQQQTDAKTKSEPNHNCASDSVITSTKLPNNVDISNFKVENEEKSNDQSNDLQTDEQGPDSSVSKCPNATSTNITDEDLKLLNREVFVTQLHEIDDKWDKIKRDMWVRHKNEADSLHAVQSLEWEWKAKETGACDVRVSLQIEEEFVPRVEVATLDY